MGTIALIIAGALWGVVPHAGHALTLREAIAEALKASPALQPARDAIEMAAIQERLERSHFGVQVAPSLQLGTLQSGLRQQHGAMAITRRLPSGTELMVSADWLRYGEGAGTQRDAGLTAAVSQSLLQAFGPALREGVTSARRASDRAARAHADARQQLVLRTAGAYFSIVRQELLVDAASQSAARAARLRQASDARARVGLATQLDVMRAELLAAQSEAALGSAREALEQARDELKILLGRPLDSPVAVAIAEISDTAGAPVDLDALQASAVERRIDVQDARERVHDAARGEAVARWASLPDVRFTASYTRRGLAGGPDIFNAWLGGWRAGVSTSYGLQRAAASAASAAASVSMRAAEREVFDREQAAAAGVRAAHRAVTRAAAAIDIQRKAVDVAERQARLASLRYERGLADNVDVIDAEMNVTLTRAAFIGARVDLALARLALQRAAGVLDPDEYLK